METFTVDFIMRLPVVEFERIIIDRRRTFFRALIDWQSDVVSADKTNRELTTRRADDPTFDKGPHA